MPEVKSGFQKTLRQRIEHYFKEHKLDRYGGPGMITKSIFMLAVFLGPIVAIGSGIVTSTWLLFLLYIISGLGMAGVGMGIMHDALHGSYSSKKWVNNLMGNTIHLIGASAAIWKVQHNILHHTYTNVDQVDDDINVPVVLRFSPHGKMYWFHKYQHIYVWFFYGLMTIVWTTTKDFVKARRYRKMGFFKRKNEFRNEVIQNIFWKLAFYIYVIALPLVMAPQAFWVVLLAFLCMHFVTGVCLSLIFQVAHVMPTSTYPLPAAGGTIKNDWSFHQLSTTTNFSPKGRIFSWLIGGLNYQIEHHLLPTVSHMHYRKISHIVKATAEEHGFPYNTSRNFLTAVADHTRMLRALGTQETPRVNI